MKMKKHASSKAIVTDPEEYCPAGTWNLPEPGSKLKCPGASKVGSWEAAARRTQHSAALRSQRSALSNILASKSAHKRRNLARENGTSVKISLTRTLLLIS